MAQVTKDQHFVPEFYLKNFAENGFIQVLHLRLRRIGKARPYQSVCYKRFFYGQKTGVEDELSQKFEDLFGAVETQIAERFPAIIEHARNKALSNGDLDTLAYMMCLQWMRTERFRGWLQESESSIRKGILQLQARFRPCHTSRLKTASSVSLRCPLFAEIFDLALIVIVGGVGQKLLRAEGKCHGVNLFAALHTGMERTPPLGRQPFGFPHVRDARAKGLQILPFPARSGINHWVCVSSFEAQPAVHQLFDERRGLHNGRSSSVVSPPRQLTVR